MYLNWTKSRDLDLRIAHYDFLH